MFRFSQPRAPNEAFCVQSAATGGRGLIPATGETTASVSHFYFMEIDFMKGIVTLSIMGATVETLQKHSLQSAATGGRGLIPATTGKNSRAKISNCGDCGNIENLR